MDREDLLFGQFIKRFSHYTFRTQEGEVEKALKLQEEEDKDDKEHRRLGEILLEMGVFHNRKGLEKALDEFEEFKRKYI